MNKVEKELYDTQDKLIEAIIFVAVKSVIRTFKEMIERCNTFEDFKRCLIETERNVCDR